MCVLIKQREKWIRKKGGYKKRVMISNNVDLRIKHWNIIKRTLSNVYRTDKHGPAASCPPHPLTGDQACKPGL